MTVQDRRAMRDDVEKEERAMDQPMAEEALKRM
jgi:hypothetical protein